MGLLVGIAAIAVWEFAKCMTKFAWRQYKAAKKADKLRRVKRLAAEAARREVKEAATSTSRGSGEPMTISPLRLSCNKKYI